MHLTFFWWTLHRRCLTPSDTYIRYNTRDTSVTLTPYRVTELNTNLTRVHTLTWPMIYNHPKNNRGKSSLLADWEQLNSANLECITKNLFTLSQLWQLFPTLLGLIEFLLFNRHQSKFLLRKDDTIRTDWIFRQNILSKIEYGIIKEINILSLIWQEQWMSCAKYKWLESVEVQNYSNSTQREIELFSDFGSHNIAICTEWC